MTDKIKLGGAAVLLGIGIWGYYWLADSALVLRILSVVAGALAGAENPRALMARSQALQR